MAYASSIYLNDLAVDSRKYGPTFLQSVGDYKIRNRGFVQGRFQFTKTRASVPIHQQMSIYGSVLHNRFTGWAEAEATSRAGKNHPHVRTTEGARGGNELKTMLPHSRLNPKMRIPKMENTLKLNQKGARTAAYLWTLAKTIKGTKKTFFWDLDDRGHNRLLVSFRAGAADEILKNKDKKKKSTKFNVYQVIRENNKRVRNLHWGLEIPLRELVRIKADQRWLNAVAWALRD